MNLRLLARGLSCGLLIAGLLSHAQLPAGSAGGRRLAARPDLLLVTIDTLRADRCSFLGYSRKTTPFLDQLAAGAILSVSVYAPSSWTAPSMASLFTSIPPAAHGVVGGHLGGRGPVRHDVLADEFETLAERLSDAGYRTLAISGNQHLSRATGFAQGFDRFEEANWLDAAGMQRLVEEVASEIATATQPVFLWLHYVDPHVPYVARSPWARRWGGTPRQRELQRSWSGRSAPYLQRNLATVLSADGREAMRTLYDSEVASADSFVDRALETLPRMRGAVTVVASDHGEAFGEHRELGHGGSLFEEEVRVPLLIRAAKGKVGAPERPTGPTATGLAGPAGPTGPAGPAATTKVGPGVSLLDVTPTVLSMLGLEPLSRAAGRDLLAASQDESGTQERERPVFLHLERGGRSLRGVRRGPWKLIEQGIPAAEGAVPGRARRQVRLFHLEQDPAETKNIAEAHASVVAELQSLLRRHQQDWPDFEPPHTLPRGDQATREQLQALGYLPSGD